MRRYGFGVVLALGGLVFAAGGLRAGEGSFDSAGVKLHYTDEGQGEPVVLVHGFSVNSQIQWALPGITKALARDYRIIMLDNRGHGQSDKPHDPKQYGLAMAEDVIRLLDHLKIKKAHLVGYSMGGFIVEKVETTHPDRVLTATLGGAGWTQTVDLQFLDALADDIAEGRGIGRLLKRLTPKGKPEPTEEQLKTVNQMFNLMNDPKALSLAMRAMRNLAVPEEALKANQVPTLALIGELDPLKEGVDALDGRMANLKVVVIKDADHMNAFSRPEFLSSLQKFLAAHRATKSSEKKAVPAGTPR